MGRKSRPRSYGEVRSTPPLVHPKLGEFGCCDQARLSESSSSASALIRRFGRRKPMARHTIGPATRETTQIQPPSNDQSSQVSPAQTADATAPPTAGNID